MIPESLALLCCSLYHVHLSKFLDLSPESLSPPSSFSSVSASFFSCSTLKLPEFGVLYTPNVSVYRSSLQQDFNMIAPPSRVAVCTVPWYVKPPVINRHTTGVGYRLRLRPLYEQGTREKFRSVLRVVKAHGHDGVVLGALGCDPDHGNPPAHLAELLSAVLAETEFAGAFKTIHIAVDPLLEQSLCEASRDSAFEAFDGVFHSSGLDNQELRDQENELICMAEKLSYG